MFVFLKVLLHLAYFALVGVIEFFVFNWLLSVSDMGVALVVSGIILVILIILYFVIFWGWRPSGGGFFDAIFDIGDIFN